MTEKANRLKFMHVSQNYFLILLLVLVWLIALNYPMLCLDTDTRRFLSFSKSVSFNLWAKRAIHVTFSSALLNQFFIRIF